MPLPELGEYTRRQNYYDSIYSLPYYFAGLVITFTGFVITPLILRRLRVSQSHVFRNAAAMTLALLVLLAIASDAGALLRIWASPLFVLHRDYDLFIIWALCQVFPPACILSGLAAIGQRWVSRVNTGRRGRDRSDRERNAAVEPFLRNSETAARFNIAGYRIGTVKCLEARFQEQPCFFRSRFSASSNGIPSPRQLAPCLGGLQPQSQRVQAVRRMWSSEAPLDGVGRILT